MEISILLDHRFVIMPLRKIWFHLFDACTGEPFKRVKATKVLMDEADDIDDLARVIVADQQPVLAGYSNTQLEFFRNKASYDANEDPIEVDTLVGSFGLSKEEALIGVVQTIPCIVTIQAEIIFRLHRPVSDREATYIQAVMPRMYKSITEKQLDEISHLFNEGY